MKSEFQEVKMKTHSVCPECGRELHPEALFCGTCGSAVTGRGTESRIATGPADAGGVEPWGADREEAATRIEPASPDRAGEDRLDPEQSGTSGGLVLEEEGGQQPKRRKRIPVWAWIALALAVVTAGVLLSGFLNPQNASIPADSSFPQGLYPSDYVNELRPGIPVTLVAGWATLEEYQAEDFIDAISYMEITLNGVELPDASSGWQGIEYTMFEPTGEELPTAIYRYRLGVLEPGTYHVHTRLGLLRDHHDGFEVFPEGLLWDWDVVFIVLDE